MRRRSADSELRTHIFTARRKGDFFSGFLAAIVAVGGPFDITGSCCGPDLAYAGGMNTSTCSKPLWRMLYVLQPRTANDSED